MVIFGSNFWDTGKLHPQCVCLEPNSILCKSSKNSPLLNHLSSHPHNTLLKCTLPSTHTLLSYFIHEGAYEVCVYNVPECVHTHFTVYMWGSDGEFFELVFASTFILSLSFFVLSQSFCTDLAWLSGSGFHSVLLPSPLPSHNIGIIDVHYYIQLFAQVVGKTQVVRLA